MAPPPELATVTIEIMAGPGFWVRLTIPGDVKLARRIFEAALKAAMWEQEPPLLKDIISGQTFEAPGTGDRDRTS